MDSDSIQKPKRGRPIKYSPEEREQAYKIKHRQVQAENYALHKEEKGQKTKHQAKLYRFAYQILKEIWKEKLVKDTRFDQSIEALFEQKQVLEY
jgi:hypothetical protein